MTCGEVTARRPEGLQPHGFVRRAEGKSACLA